MKRIVAILICLSMLFALSACGGSNSSVPVENGENNKTENDTETKTEEKPDSDTITSEEKFDLQMYASIIEILNDYEEGGSIKVQALVDGEDVKYYDQDAVRYCYNKLAELTSVDKWLGTELTSDPDINWDRKAVMADFVVIEDVRLEVAGVNEDAVGNKVNRVVWGDWEYDEEGRVSLFAEQGVHGSSSLYTQYVPTVIVDENPCDTNYRNEYTYDENGKITEINYTWDKVYVKGTPSYDASGKMISVDYVTVDGDTASATYTYDSEGRLASLVCPWLSQGDNIHGDMLYKYTYNDDGNVVKVDVGKSYEGKENYFEVFEYTYDINGNLIESKYTNINTVVTNYITGETTTQIQEENYTYTCDENGRVISAEITYGDRIATEDGSVVERSTYKRCDVDVTYGNYYIYTPATQEG